MDRDSGIDKLHMNIWVTNGSCKHTGVVYVVNNAVKVKLCHMYSICDHLENKMKLHNGFI